MDHERRLSVDLMADGKIMLRRPTRADMLKFVASGRKLPEAFASCGNSHACVTAIDSEIAVATCGGGVTCKAV